MIKIQNKFLNNYIKNIKTSIKVKALQTKKVYKLNINGIVKKIILKEEIYV